MIGEVLSTGSFDNGVTGCVSGLTALVVVRGNLPAHRVDRFSE
jgi:hypothetical protein